MGFNNQPMNNPLFQRTSVFLLRGTWREEPSGLQYMGLKRVGHDEACKLHLQRTETIVF